MPKTIRREIETLRELVEGDDADVAKIVLAIVLLADEVRQLRDQVERALGEARAAEGR